MNGRCAECWRYRQVSATRHQQHHEDETRTGYPSIHGSISQCHFWSSDPWGSKVAIGWFNSHSHHFFARINILKFLPYKRVSLIAPFVIKVIKWLILVHHVLKCIWNGLTQSNLPIVLINWVLNSFFSQIWFIQFFPNIKVKRSSASTRRLWGLPVASRLGKGYSVWERISVCKGISAWERPDGFVKLEVQHYNFTFLSCQSQFEKSYYLYYMYC